MKIPKKCPSWAHKIETWQRRSRVTLSDVAKLADASTMIVSKIK